jgi:hypothetical protein
MQTGCYSGSHFNAERIDERLPWRPMAEKKPEAVESNSPAPRVVVDALI